MKKIVLITLFLATGLAMGLTAQSLQDNPDYRKSVELKQQSELAFDEGDFKEARRLAEESLEYAARSDEWIAMMLDRYRANSALRRVETQLQSAARVQADVHFPDEYAAGKTLYGEADRFFRGEEFVSSYEKSLEALEVMSVIRYVRSDRTPRPSAYEVRDLPENADCLWNIAGYDFVYGDPWQWKKLYEANRDIMPDSGNPDLIVPGMILTIPPEGDEERTGTWRDGEIG